MGKIKQKPLIEKKCTGCYSPTHLKFNFSFISYQENFTDEHKAKLMDRLFQISKEPYLVVAGWRKEIGFEYVKLDIKKDIDPRYFESPKRTFDGKYNVMRLYTNNNPKPSRIIGKIENKIFYIFFIDIDGTLYSH